MAKIRLFIAFSLPTPLQSYLDRICDDLGQSVPLKSIRWVKSESIHLTLRFLGDTPENQVAEVGREIDRIAECHAAFELQLDRLGCFPNPRRPRVIWAGIKGNNEKLQMVQGEIEAMVNMLGWEPEGRRYHPHLTLGRVKNSSQVVQGRLPWGSELDPMPIPASEIHLIESQLQRGGAVYIVRHGSSLLVVKK
jgi:2'-5' RNA ligase